MTVIEAIQKCDPQALAAALAADPASINQRDASGIPAVLLALYHRRQDMAETLLAAGAAIDWYTACALGCDVNPPLNERSPDGWTALHLAAFFNHPDLVKTLLARGAVPLARSSNSLANLPLHAAAAGRSLESVRLLLEAGTPRDATQAGGFTALDSARQNNDQAMIDLLSAASSPAA